MCCSPSRKSAFASLEIALTLPKEKNLDKILWVSIFLILFIGGKTTCIALLEHFYEPDEGEVLIDNIPVQNYDYKFYHEKVCLLLKIDYFGIFR